MYFFKSSKNPHKIASFLLIAFLAVFLNSSETHAKKFQPVTPERLYEQARQEYYPLLGSKSKKARRDQWIKVIEKFQAVRKKFPSSFEANKALYTIARLYHLLYSKSKNNHDLENALSHYRKVVENFRSSQFADDALYQQGEIFLERKNYALAMKAYQAILANFPEGDQTGSATKRIEYLGSLVKKKSPRGARKTHAPILLQKVTFSSTPRVTTVTLYTNARTQLTQNRLPNPDRFYLDFLGTRLNDTLQNYIVVKNKVLRGIRLRQFKKNVSRVVFDLDSAGKIKILTRTENNKVIVEFQRPPKPVLAAKANAPKPARTLAVQAPKAEPAPARNAKKTANLPGGRPLIVVDPGHGGKDHGAKSRTGLLEKNVNLAISKRLKKILETRYGYKVIMTRTRDKFLPLEKRGHIANENNARLFVSIHANAAKRKGAHGIETYSLGLGSSERARQTAARENGRVIYSGPDSQVQKI
ncbi:MAG: N-acetylmuramoyl-L-alanine amidase, partial [Nitrospinales bacterium]